MNAESLYVVRFAAGTTVQLIISTANVDPEVFGGEMHSREEVSFDFTSVC